MPAIAASSRSRQIYADTVSIANTKSNEKNRHSTLENITSICKNANKIIGSMQEHLLQKKSIRKSTTSLGRSQRSRIRSSLVKAALAKLCDNATGYVCIDAH
jgi:hypothetical protein